MAHHPHATVLRQRAGHLRELASVIESTPAMYLDRAAGRETWSMPKALVCEGMLAGNLQQLHRAAEQLRETAYGFLRRADELDAALRAGNVA